MLAAIVATTVLTACSTEPRRMILGTWTATDTSTVSAPVTYELSFFSDGKMHLVGIVPGKGVVIDHLGKWKLQRDGKTFEFGGDTVAATGELRGGQLLVQSWGWTHAFRRAWWYLW